MMKVLVPIDFSDSSKKALEYALDIGKQISIDVHMLYVTSPPSKMGTKLVHKIQEVAKEEDRDVVNHKTGEFLKGLEIGDYLHKEIMIRYGDVSKQIVNVSLQEDFDLIVMGTKGASWLKETFIGSNTFSTLKISLIPIIVVPRSFSHDPENHKACIALKFEKLYSDSCAKLIDKTKELGYIPDIMTVVGRKSESIEMEVKHENIAYPIEIYNSTKPREVISDYINKNNIGLLALHFNAYSFFKELTYHSVSTEFTFRSPIPILFMR